MLKLTGTRKILCDGLPRRDLLHLGGLGMFGLPLCSAWRLKSLQAAPAESVPASFGRARSCILIHLFGSPPQHETFDPKPAAPAEVQGEMRAISTSVPGVEIGEGLPQTAQVVDRLTMVRSLTHALPFHGVHYAISGIPTISSTVEADPNDRSLWPSIGSVVDYMDARRDEKAAEVPRNIGLPFVLYSRANFRPLGGPYAGFLGSRYDPIWSDFSARGTRAVPNPAGKPDVFDPYGGIRPEDRFDLAGVGETPRELGARRIERRRTLLQQFDAARRWGDGRARVARYNRYEELAWSLLTSNRMGEALDVQREPAAIRERYGMTLFGQSLLAARRLVESGGRFVTVFWDAYDSAGAGWDTHTHHYARLRQLLLPGFDAAFSALILDLEDRGLLDETLVVCVSEHGRTPRLTDRPGAGREHWSRVYSGVMAGGGVARGRVVGQSDRIGGEVLQTPVSPKDVLATSLHLLGIDPHTTVPDLLGRPVPVAGDGILRTEFLG